MPEHCGMLAMNGDQRMYKTGRPGRHDSIRSVLARHGEPFDATTEPPEETPEQHSTGAVFAEVRVNPMIGQIHVTRILGACDPGRVLNRRTIRSQVIGGFVWAGQAHPECEGTMNDMWEQLHRLGESGTPSALATVVTTYGSATPRPGDS